MDEKFLWTSPIFQWHSPCLHPPSKKLWEPYNINNNFDHNKYIENLHHRRWCRFSPIFFLKCINCGNRFFLNILLTLHNIESQWPACRNSFQYSFEIHNHLRNWKKKYFSIKLSVPKLLPMDLPWRLDLVVTNLLDIFWMVKKLVVTCTYELQKGYLRMRIICSTSKKFTYTLFFL